MCTVKGNEDVVITYTCVEASAAAELKCSEGGKGNKEVSFVTVITSVEGVAVTEMDGQSTSSVLVVNDSGASQRDPLMMLPLHIQIRQLCLPFQIPLCLHYHHPHLFSQLFWR